MSLTYVRANEKKLQQKLTGKSDDKLVAPERKRVNQVTYTDIVGVLSIKRLLGLILLLTCFIVVQTWLHIRYLTIETNRAIFSSFKHFETSEDMSKDPLTVILIIANALFGLFYAVLYILEAIRSFLSFRRL